MKEYMIKTLKKFLDDETVARIEASGSRMWSSIYQESKLKTKPKICVIFSRYQHDNISETILGTAGYVLAIPSYWIDVDKDLTTIFISSYVDRYIAEYIDKTGTTQPGCDIQPPFCPPIHNCDGTGHYPPPPPKPEGYPPVPPCIISDTTGEGETTSPDISKANFTYTSPVDPDKI